MGCAVGSAGHLRLPHKRLDGAIETSERQAMSDPLKTRQASRFIPAEGLGRFQFEAHSSLAMLQALVAAQTAESPAAFGGGAFRMLGCGSRIWAIPHTGDPLYDVTTLTALKARIGPGAVIRSWPASGLWKARPNYPATSSRRR
jgi:hypothetical protein